MRKAFLVLATVLFPANILRAAERSGAEPFDFLFMDGGARAAAMGGAYSAVSGEPDSLLYNPAGLVGTERHRTTFMHNSYLAGITQEYAAYADPGGWGINFNRLDSGDVKRTTVSNPAGTGLGDAELTDLLVSAGYAGPVTAALTLGGGVKLIREDADGTTGSGWAADIGTLYKFRGLPGLVAAFALQNMGPSVKFQDKTEHLPFNMRAGAAYKTDLWGKKSLFSADLMKERSENIFLKAGTEITVYPGVTLRLGYNGRNDAGSGITLGAGYTRKDLELSYAFIPFGDLGSANYFSISYQWGKRP
jgi:hypothetical protein